MARTAYAVLSERAVLIDNVIDNVMDIASIIVLSALLINVAVNLQGYVLQ